MLIIETILTVILGILSIGAVTLGVHVLVEDSPAYQRAISKLKRPDEVEMLKRTTLELEAEAEKREEMEHWAQRLERAERKLRRAEVDEPERGENNRFADEARYEFKYPGDKIGTEMRQAREASREFGETADELGERMERAIHERFQKYKAEIKKRERTKQRTEKYDIKRMEQQRKRIPLEMVYQYHNTAPHRRPPGGMSELARIHDLARRTIDNEFGIGQERMQRLGPDYEPVQAEVNRILKKATQKTNRRP